MKIQIILGSTSDMPVADKAKKILDQFTVDYDVKVASAHRTPDIVEDLVKNNEADVFIGVAGLAAALPGAIASHTIKPVIGVPVSGKVNFDSILSIIQMPPGIPTAAVGLDRGDNAALLALEILGLQDSTIAAELKNFRKQMRENILKSN
jgi:5-(carboxyamino)imidazole ribonucleotide mutase